MTSKGKKILLLAVLSTFLLNAEGTTEGGQTPKSENVIIIKEEKTEKTKSGQKDSGKENRNRSETQSEESKPKDGKGEKEGQRQGYGTERGRRGQHNSGNEKTSGSNVTVEVKSEKKTEEKKADEKNLSEISSKKEKKKPEIDKKKPVVKAVEKEMEGISEYHGNLIKFIATADGKVIKKGDETKKHPIASLTKVMNVLVALDQVDKGNARLNDRICFTDETVNLGGSWLNAKSGDCFELKDLLRAEIIYSANNASYLVAHHIGKGNPDNFVKLMNDKANELGMKNTQFYTPAGLPSSMTKKDMDVSTAYDVYLLARAAIQDERINEWASETELVLLNSKGEQVIYNNRNRLLDKYGIFGLKTGFHAKAGYNMMVASKIGNIEIISISLGNKTDIDRTRDQENEFAEITRKMKVVYKSGQEISNFRVRNAMKKEIKGVLSENVYQLDNTGYTFKVKDLNVTTTKNGIKKGDVVGKLEVINNNEIIQTIDIVASEETPGLTLFGKVLRFLTFGVV